MNYGPRFVTLYRRQGKEKEKENHPQENEMQKGKMAVWGGLKIAVKRKEVKSKGEKERYKHLNAEFQKMARRDRNAVINAKK